MKPVWSVNPASERVMLLKYFLASRRPINALTYVENNLNPVLSVDLYPLLWYFV